MVVDEFGVVFDFVKYLEKEYEECVVFVMVDGVDFVISDLVECNDLVWCVCLGVL